jgi:phenylacetate-CoA ligase
LDPVFKRHLAIREAQVIQEALDLVRVRYVPADGFSDADADAIITGLRARMGSVQVLVEPVEAIPRTANGKFRSVVCNVDPGELRRVRAH